MIDNIEDFMIDFCGLRIHEIGRSKQTGAIHFICKNEKGEWVGFSVSPEHITAFKVELNGLNDDYRFWNGELFKRRTD